MVFLDQTFLFQLFLFVNFFFPLLGGGGVGKEKVGRKVWLEFEVGNKLHYEDGFDCFARLATFGFVNHANDTDFDPVRYAQQFASQTAIMCNLRLP